LKLAVTFSSKEGLEKEYRRRYAAADSGIPEDFFAEGDSWATINNILESLKGNGHDVSGIEADEEVGENLRKAGPDLVFNIAEGLFGDFRESYVPMICERMGIPYTGSGPLELAICLNKARAKEVLAFNGIPTPDFRVIEPDLPIRLDRFRFPAIIKPVAEGSSKGIFDDSVVESKAEAVKKIQAAFLKYRQPVLVEQFLEGDEFTVAVWGNGDKVEVLPIVAIRYDDLPAGARPIYSYEAKWIWDTPEKPLEIFKCPASISKTRQKAIETVVRAAYRVLHIKDWCRIDVRLDGKGKPHILELNPLPGILPKPEDNSCFPKAARTAGYDYPAMLEKIIGIAAERWGIRA